MDYTLKKETAIFESLDFDDGEYNQSKIKEILNHDFRSFGDGLQSIIEQKENKTIEDPMDYIKDKCIENGIDLSEIAGPKTIKSWFKEKKRPKKGETDRRKMFALSFALNLTTDETKDLMNKVYLDRAFDKKNYRELIYYHCIKNGLSLSEADDMIAAVNINNNMYPDVTVYTNYIEKETSMISNGSDLVTYINEHNNLFYQKNSSAKRIIEEFKEKSREFAKEEKEKNDQLIDPALSSNKDTDSDNFLYSIIMNQEISTGKGTEPLPFKNSTFPEEIKKNFPGTLSSKTNSYEKLRKIIILVFSYWFWHSSLKYNEYDIYDEYITHLNNLLEEANMPLLYYGNPYDWMFLYCTATDIPLDTFRSIIAAVLNLEDDN